MKKNKTKQNEKEKEKVGGMGGTKVAEIKSEHHTAHRVQTPKPGGEGGVGIHAMLGKKQPSPYSCTHPVTFRPGPCLTSFTNGPDVFENVIPPASVRFTPATLQTRTKYQLCTATREERKIGNFLRRQKC